MCADDGNAMPTCTTIASVLSNSLKDEKISIHIVSFEDNHMSKENIRKMRNIAVILAGGIGSRVGGETPKQLLPLADGRSILEHSIDAFEASPSIDEIAVVMHPDHISSLQKLCQSNRWQKLTKIIPGGAERWESSYNAIKACTESANLDEPLSLLLHDAARPFVSQRIIADVCQALETHEAVTVAVPVTDTIYEVWNNEVQEVKNRRDFMRAQTPRPSICTSSLRLLRTRFKKATLPP